MPSTDLWRITLKSSDQIIKYFLFMKYRTKNIWLFGDLEASSGVGARACVTRDRLWVRFPLEELKYLLFSFPCSRQCSITQQAMLPEFSVKWRSESLNTRFFPLTLQYTRYCVKVIKIFFFLSRSRPDVKKHNIFTTMCATARKCKYVNN